MTLWPKKPVIYEINTWVWLHDLSERYGCSITLSTVPLNEWNDLASLGVDAVWLMGVWERSPAGIRISLGRPDLQAEYRRALPDLSEKDVVGSPYSVHRYVVDHRLGGPEGLADARDKLQKHGIRLILDFVPNHVASDHPWVYEHPEYFIQGGVDDLKKAPGEFFETPGKLVACGRDPYFPPWTDTAQLNAFHPGLRRSVIEAVSGIADQCDGLRCDMAMLVMNPVFEKTWGKRAGIRPASEYWSEVISGVRKKCPDILFVAEAYWDLEWELQQHGFNYCYDKRLYDRLAHGKAEAVRLHLLADLSYQNKLVRFIENHDEARAAATFSPKRSRAAAIAIATLPGAKLFHEGQFEGRRVKLPLQLGRRPVEPIDRDLVAFYHKLFKEINTARIKEGEWHLCKQIGWPDNTSYLNLVGWCLRGGEEKYLVVVNLSDQRSQGRIQLPWSDLAHRSWRLTDLVCGEVYERKGDEMMDPGLFVELEGWGFHFLKF